MAETPQRRTRKEPRISCTMPVIINNMLTCTAFDLSEGGLYINTSEGMFQGRVVTVSIESGAESLELKARVKHVLEGVGSGLMFIDLDNILKNKIRKIVAEVEKAAG